MRSRRSLHRALETACAAALAATAIPGCCFGRSYGPSHNEYLHPIDAATAAKASADGSLPSDVCDKACGSFSSAELTGCHVVTVDIPPPPQKRWLTWKYRADGKGAELNNGTMLNPEDADALGEGGPLDDSICRAHTHQSEAIWGCELATRKPIPARGASMAQCHVYVPGGCDMSFGSGRDSHVRSTPLTVGTSAIGWLVRSAQLEASSVRAFRDLVPQLARVGARRSLLRATRRAARDEERHARMLRATCRARGASVPALRFSPTRPRGDAELACENVGLGCVGELFAAAVACHQSAHALDADLRRASAIIARDEARHAELSFRIFWHLLPRLDADERERALRTMEHAIVELHGTLPWSWSANVAELGLPEPTAVAALIASLDETSWTPLRRALSGQRAGATSAR